MVWITSISEVRGYMFNWATSRFRHRL